MRPTVDGRYVWQLNANGWHFAAGHVAKLELLGADSPYARPSNGPFTVTVSDLELRLPVRDLPDCRTIRPTANPVLPPGYRLAPGVAAARTRSAAYCLRSRRPVRGGRA
jgi:hypothetical protein